MLSPLLALRRDGGDGHPPGADLGGEKNCGQLGGDPCRTEPVIDEDTSHAHPAQGDGQWPCRSLRQPRHAQLMQGHSFPKQPVDTRRSSVQLRWCTARLQWCLGSHARHAQCRGCGRPAAGAGTSVQGPPLAAAIHWPHQRAEYSSERQQQPSTAPMVCGELATRTTRHAKGNNAMARPVPSTQGAAIAVTGPHLAAAVDAGRRVTV